MEASTWYKVNIIFFFYVMIKCKKLVLTTMIDSKLIFIDHVHKLFITYIS